jgi:hypothetical protein
MAAFCLQYVGQKPKSNHYFFVYELHESKWIFREK